MVAVPQKPLRPPKAFTHCVGLGGAPCLIHLDVIVVWGPGDGFGDVGEHSESHCDVEPVEHVLGGEVHVFAERGEVVGVGQERDELILT